jgi:formate dehydrogenase gamma subunit
MSASALQGLWPRCRRLAVTLSLFILIFCGVGASAAEKKLSSSDCLACHADASLTKEVNGKQIRLDVNQEKFNASIHGQAGLGCTDCHADVQAFPHEPAPQKPTCATCHADQGKAYTAGIHAQAIRGGDKNAATCIDCHGGPHDILPGSDPSSKVNHAHVPNTCGACHGQKFVMEASGLTAQPFINYEQSVHGKSVAKSGQSKAAVCTDCHGAHDIMPGGNPKSPIFKANVPVTCAKCHADVEKEFMASIHGQAIERGNWQAPVCTDCHGIHTIKAPTDPTSSVAAQNLATSTCGRCHESVRLASEFGVPSGRASTYLASYHGLASEMGSSVVANCASCHGVHNILPSSDPRSTINKANLAKTCGHCHPGAGRKFVEGKIHINAPLSADIGSVAVRWIRRMYLGMILGLIGAMLLHNFILWRRKALAMRQAHRRIVVRMDPKQRLQHLTLLVSFVTLVLTGFALKYPDSWLAAVFVNESVRSNIHRVAGVVLIAVGFFHLAYLLTDREGRRLFLDMLPVFKDATDLFGTMRYYLGWSQDKPQFARFNYAEKMEYWALVWGTVVMAVTGLALWFKVPVGNALPRWWLDVATAIHFYEAVLATLAIVVWHFYMVIFDPDTYPMNWAWFDGRMSVEHYQQEHALDSETILRSVEQAAHPVDAPVLLDVRAPSQVGNGEPSLVGKREPSLGEKHEREEPASVPPRRR